MKKFLAILVTAILAVTACLGLTACGGNGKTLTLGFDADFPPYGFEKDGKYVGFDIEFAQKVCGNLGYNLKLTPIDWDAKDAMLDSGAIDFIWNGFTYQGREEDYEWTVQYLNNSIVVLTLDENIQTLADLSGKKVAAQSDSSGEEAINSADNAALKASFASFDLEAQYVVANEKLVAGSYDAIIVDYGVAKYLRAQNGNLLIVGEAVSTETYAVGFKKGNTELCKEISDEMIKVGQDETFIKGLCEKYGVEYDAFLLKDMLKK